MRIVIENRVVFAMVCVWGGGFGGRVGVGRRGGWCDMGVGVLFATLGLGKSMNMKISRNFMRYQKYHYHMMYLWIIDSVLC